MASNPIFRVNGLGLDALTSTLQLACAIRDGSERRHLETRVRAYVIDPENGFVLLWSDSQITEHKNAGRFPVPLSPDEVAPMVLRWLESDEAWQTPLEEWCENFDHDGTNKKGWLVYTGDWGHVGPHIYALCAVKPAYIWFGK